VYNAAHLEGAGVEISSDWDWDAFVATNRALAHWAESTGARFSSAALSDDLQTWVAFLRSNGGGFVDPETLEIMIDRPESLEALRRLQEHLEDSTFGFAHSSSLRRNLAINGSTSLGVIESS